MTSPHQYPRTQLKKLPNNVLPLTLCTTYCQWANKIAIAKAKPFCKLMDGSALTGEKIGFWPDQMDLSCDLCIFATAQATIFYISKCNK